MPLQLPLLLSLPLRISFEAQWLRGSAASQPVLLPSTDCLSCPCHPESALSGRRTLFQPLQLPLRLPWPSADC